MPGHTAFFRRDGESYVPTGLGTSPWTGSSQGGVPLAGLSAHLLSRVPTLAAAMHMARLTIDILGTVPIEPLVPRTNVVREGRRVQLATLELGCGGRCFVRASALRLRTEETPARAAPLAHAFPTQPHDPRRSEMTETLPVDDEPAGAGNGARWVRFLHPVVEGEAISPIESVAMLADFGSGIAPLLAFDRWTFANVDIALHLERPPRSDWMLIDARTDTAGNGFGIVTGRLGDREGMIGTSHQTIFLARR